MNHASPRWSFSRFFGRLVIGVVASFLGTAIATGSLADAAAFMLLSIICTAGMSLVVWIPIWWGVGWIIMALIGLISGTGKNNVAKSDSNRLPITTSDQVVAQFITRARACGLDSAEIQRRLVEAGWTDNAIRSATLLADRWKTNPAT
jgi:hypothetical protein